MMQITLVSLFLVAQIMSVDAGSHWYSTIHEQCRTGQSIFRLRGAYSKSYYDRSWSFHCRPDSRITSSCSWSGFVNSYNGEILYQCPNGVIAGVYSKHHTSYRDRKFSFKCCGAKKYLHTCQWTSYINSSQDYLSYQVKNGYFLSGAKSHYGSRDRVWRFLICKIA